MSMTFATILVGLILLAKGLTLFTMKGDAAFQRGLKFLRDRRVAAVLLAVASAWFLWVVINLGQADFGDYKVPLFVLFLGVAVGSWFYVPDFLGVRAGCVIFMLLAWHCLGAAFGHYEVPARLFMVSAVYVGIVFSLYMAAAPYRARDMAEWFCARPTHARVLGGLLAAYGVWLLLVPMLFY
jgi:hypothetical protein